MWKTFAMAALSMLILVGCASVPKHCNLTGQWKYYYQVDGSDEADTGTMTLAQSSYALSGKANDGMGEFALTGALDGINFKIDGVKNDKKRSFTMQAVLKSEDEFTGTYSTDQKTSGKIWGSRLVSK